MEAELSAEIPRHIPESLRLGSYGRSLRNQAIAALLFGIPSFLAADTYWIEDLSWTLLPLTYLKPIAVVICLFGVIQLLRWRSNGGPYRYLREGQASKATVRSIRVVPGGEWNGQVLNATAVVELETEAPVFGSKSHRVESQSFTPHTELTLAEGDEVTVVTLPDDKWSMKIYGFMGLNPTVNYLQKTRPAITPLHLLVILFFVGLLFGVWAIASFPVLDEPNALLYGSLAGGLVLGLLPYFGFWRLRKAVEAELGENEPCEGGAEAALSWAQEILGTGWRRFTTAAGLLLLGAALSFAALSFLNGTLDGSGGELREVEFQGLTQTTHCFVWATYEVKFVDPETGEGRYDLEPRQFPTQQVSKMMVEVSPGAFGWRWISDVKFE